MDQDDSWVNYRDLARSGADVGAFYCPYIPLYCFPRLKSMVENWINDEVTRLKEENGYVFQFRRDVTFESTKTAMDWALGLPKDRRTFVYRDSSWLGLGRQHLTVEFFTEADAAMFIFLCA